MSGWDEVGRDLLGRGPRTSRCVREQSATADGPKARICRIQGSPYESKLSTGPLKRQTPHFRAASALLIALRGEDEIRTRGTLETYVGLANRWFQPLTHLSRGTVPRVLSNLFVWSGLQRYKNKLFRNRGGGKRLHPDEILAAGEEGDELHQHGAANIR